MSQPFIFGITSEKGLDLINEITYELFNFRQVFQKCPCCTNLFQNTLVPFPSTYLVECAFSAVTDLLCIKRAILDVSERGDLCAELSFKFKPRLAAICFQYQAQGSH